MTEASNGINILYRRIPEITVPDKPLGRHVVHDPRSKEHPFSAISPDGEKKTYKIRDRAWVPMNLPFNQGNVGKCTCEACCGALNTTPNSHHSPASHPELFHDGDTDQLYIAETTMEGMPWPQY